MIGVVSSRSFEGSSKPPSRNRISTSLAREALRIAGELDGTVGDGLGTFDSAAHGGEISPPSDRDVAESDGSATAASHEEE